jgi:hypothetical protein
VLASRSFEEQAQEMADRGVVLLRDDTGLLPLDATRPQRGFLLVVSADPDSYPGEDMERELRPRVDSLVTARMDRLYFEPDELKLPSPLLYDWAIVAVFVRIADRKGNVALPDEMAAVVNELLQSGKPTALAIMGSPYLAERFPQAKTVLCTFSTASVAEHAAVRGLFGQSEITGQLPVTIPDVAALGAGLRQQARPMELIPEAEEEETKFQPVATLLQQAVEQGVTPGGVLAVGHRGRLVALEPFGRLTYDEDSRGPHAVRHRFAYQSCRHYHGRDDALRTWRLAARRPSHRLPARVPAWTRRWGQGPHLGPPPAHPL